MRLSSIFSLPADVEVRFSVQIITDIQIHIPRREVPAVSSYQNCVIYSTHPHLDLWLGKGALWFLTMYINCLLMNDALFSIISKGEECIQDE